MSSVVVIATPHDVHEKLTSQALTAGRDVWCEKPLALTSRRRRGGEGLAGFRAPAHPRLQPALGARRAGRAAGLAAAQAPKLVVYRIAAGRIPDGHWYLDRRQGGRLLGEVCHFVDLAQALVGAAIEDAAGVLGGDAAQGDDGVAVALRFADGSVATSPMAAPRRWQARNGSRSSPDRGR